MIGFVYNQYIWNLHDSGLQKLKDIAASRLDDQDDGVRDVHDVDLGLPHESMVAGCDRSRISGADRIGAELTRDPRRR